MKGIALLLIAFLTIGCLLCAPGCKPGELRPHTNATRGILYVDLSNPTPEAVQANGYRGFLFQDDLSGNATVKITLFAHRLEVIYDSEARLTRKQYHALLTKAIPRVRPETTLPGTRIEKVFADAAANLPTEPFAICIATDGGVEDASEPVLRSLRTNVSLITSSPHFRGLYVIGVLQNHRQWWTDLLGPKAIVKGEFDGTDPF